MLFDIPLFSSFGSGGAYRIGVDISSSSVKVVELSGRGGKYVLEGYAVELLPKDLIQDGNISNVAQVGEALRRGLKRVGAHTKNVAIALPSSTAITKKITVSANQKEEDLELTVEAEANQSIPFPLDEVNLDYWVIGPAPNVPGEIEVLIAAARREKVEDYAAVAESAGAKPMIIDIESLAIQHAFAAIAPTLAGKGRGKNIALFDMGVNNTRFYVFHDNDILFSREMSFGGNQLTVDIQRAYNLPSGEAETAKKAGGLPENYRNDVLRPYMDNVAMEIARALQFFSTTTTFGPVQQIVLSGGCSLINGLDRAITQQASVPVVIANPFAAIKASNHVRAQQLAQDTPLLLTATGLALRSFES
ncbi:MAG: pilus assembly protein PilM [Burkholderiales bacterium]|jgi:type IV pilus assembly protein PilM|nr:pilus assembly protein PilM [Burkholderiales bacterium]